MAKQTKKKLNYFAGRLGYTGAPIAAVCTEKSKEEVIARYPQWRWETSDKEFFDSITDKCTILPNE